MRIDAHQHFWNYNPHRDLWITDNMSTLKSNYLPEDIYPLLQKNELSGCICVQASQSDGETDFLRELSSSNDWIVGVIGWIDLKYKHLEERLDLLHTAEKLKGWRHVVEGESSGYMLDSNFLRGIEAIGKYGYTYDFLIHSGQLLEAIEVVKKFPDQKFIIDHMAKPPIKTGEIKAWKKYMETLSNYDNVWCKVSGLVTQADWVSWHYSDMIPYLEVVVNSFGVDRLIYGSDWPVCLLASSYERQLKVVEQYFSSFTTSEKDKVFGDNAASFYNL